MSLIRQLALVCEPEKNHQIQPRQLTSVCAALQKQITCDFGPIWDISATIDPFVSLADVPLGYWPIVVAEDIKTEGTAGVHLDRMGQPFALVRAGDLWSLTASHEALEILADPFGNRTVSGLPPNDFNKPVSATVEYLLEVCDPCEDVDNAYAIDGIPVSDFYTPRYFDSHEAAGVQYDFAGKITKPRQVLPYGYLSWHNAIDDEWYQLRMFDGIESFKRLRKLTNRGTSMRSIVDRQTPTRLERDGLSLNPGNSRIESCPQVYCPTCEIFHMAKKSGRLLDTNGGSGNTFDPTKSKASKDGLTQDADALRRDIERVKKATAKQPKSSQPVKNRPRKK